MKEKETYIGKRKINVRTNIITVNSSVPNVRTNTKSKF